MNQSAQRNTEAIVIMGGSIRRDEKGEWHSTGFDEPGDDFGVVGDNIRIIAGSYLYQDNPNQIVIALGGKGQLAKTEGSVPVSAVLKKELMELGAPEEKIIEESKSGNTFEQLRELKKIIEQMKFEKINIISNRYHLPRIEAMIEFFPELKEMKKLAEIKFIEAEKTVIEHNREKWEKIIEFAYESEEMKKRISSEQRGINDLKEGKYRVDVKLK